jgi:hypothetical protein
MPIRRAGEQWREPSVDRYSDETELQALIEGAPDLLPGGVEPLAIAREVAVSSGYIDIVGVEPSGQIVLCECKLEANENSRRKVVGQLLAYAGAIWEMDPDEFIEAFSQRVNEPLVDAVRELGGDDWSEEQFRRGLACCLESGSLRLVVAVDSISEGLKKTLRFLNEHSSHEVEFLALEIGYTRDGDIEIIVPHVYGEELTSPKRPRKRWSEAELLSDLGAGSSAAGFRAVSEFWELLKRHATRIDFGTGLHPSGSAYLLVDGVEQPVFSIYAYAGD